MTAWTVPHAFEKSPCPEEDLRECELIFYPHCTRNHWTLYVCFVQLQVFYFFDPMHGTDKYYVAHREAVFVDFRKFLDEIAQQDVGTPLLGCSSAAEWLRGIDKWPLRDALELNHALPRQRSGLGCALHIFAFAMDVLSGTHHTFTDPQALSMRRWLKFVLASGTAERMRE